MDELTVGFDLGVHCETYKLTKYIGSDIALRHFYNKDVIERYFELLYNNDHCTTVQSYSNGEATLFVGSLKPNKSNFVKAVLRIEGQSAKLYMLGNINEKLVVVLRDLKALSLKTGLTKTSPLTKHLASMKVSSPNSNSNVVKDSNGSEWTVPEDWLKAIKCK